MLVVEICLAVFVIGILTFAKTDIEAKKETKAITPGPAIVGLIGSLAGMAGSVVFIAKTVGWDAFDDANASITYPCIVWMAVSIGLFTLTVRVLSKKKWLSRPKRAIP